MKTFSYILIFISFTLTILQAQPWQQNDAIFNPSGIPSLSFSQPRFADVDADNDFDLILGGVNDRPLFFENIGSVANPSFQAGVDIFSHVASLDAEMGVFHDLDNDGDLDFICGGFTGLNFYDNIGDSSSPSLQKVNLFFAGLVVGSNPVPTLTDMDADSDLDLLVGLSENGSLKYFPNSGSPDSAIYLEANSQTWYDVGLYAYPYFSDLDNDGDFDLMVGKDIHGFSYYKNIGDSSAWQWQDASFLFAGLGSATYWNSPCLVDLTNDNKNDLIYGTASGPLNYYRNTGSATSPSWSVNTSLFGGVLDVGGASSPCLIDFDFDGDFDILSGVQLGSPKYYRNIGTPAAPAWQANHSYFSSISHSIYLAVTAGDVNGDSLPDVVAGDLNGHLFFHQNTGIGFMYDSTTFDGIDLGDWSAPKLFDMDYDNDFDIVAGNDAGNLFYFENSGSPDSASWQEISGYFGTIDVGSNCVPALGDIDSDGDMDIFTGDISHNIQFFRNDSGTWTEDPTVVSGITAGQNAAPALADLDNDGDLDLIIGNYDGTFNYYENQNATFIPSSEEYFFPNKYLLVNVYPNPFNLSTVFNIKIQKAGNLQLKIFNQLGQTVIDENIGYKNTQQFQYRLNFPNNLASGIYYYSVVLQNEHSAKNFNGKIILLK
jgi:VCBS repeat protein/type IX secretion system substrate protein